VTGYGGYTNVSEVESEIILDETITIRFDASLERDMPWEFMPVERQVEVKFGETALAFYEAYNPTSRPIAGSASYNVTPYGAGSFFNKIDCFCFQEQILQPGERVQMPVTFFVDPELVNDKDAKFAKTITLSYTFYEIDLPVDEAKFNSNYPSTDLNSDSKEGQLWHM
jgi:cytochrome c oxidase assembly protein subunit 11